MITPLLKTKLYVPPARPELVSRPHLIERLEAGLDRKLTLISAPAGFGKTTLLIEWVAGSEWPVAWISLDAGDNDPARFLAYFVAALQTVEPMVGGGMLAAFQAPEPPPMEAILTTLINEIAAPAGPGDGEARPVILVLDDYHLITAQPIHDGLTFLLDHLPPNLHLVVAARADPPLPLSRLRGRGQLTELRTADLRFTPDEAAAFLNQVMGLGLSAEDVAALETRTEGWIVGLQMAALWLQGRDSQRVAHFVSAFTGSHRYVLDYLTDEVLLQQPESVRTFLLQTAILDRLSGPLCDAVRFGGAESPSAAGADTVRFGSAGSPGSSEGTAVTGWASGQEMLERLDIANLFIIPLDDERSWYRYHHLFADLLRKRLSQAQPDLLPTLHRRASDWYEQHGLIPDAVSHALAAADVERAAHLVEGRALAMIFLGELTTLVGLLAELPDEVVSSRPWLCIAHAWALMFSGLLDAVELRLESAEDALDAFGDTRPVERTVLSPAEGRHIAGHAAAIRAYVAALRRDMSCAAELTREALDQLPEEDLAVRSLSEGLLGSVLRWSGDLVAATRASTRAIAISQAASDSHTAVEALYNLAAVQFAQGQLHKTVATCREVILLAGESAKRGGRRPPIAASGCYLISQVLREWNDLEGALRHASEGIGLSEQWGWPEGLAFGYRRLARARQSVGDTDGALEAIEKARQAACSLSPWFGAHMAAHQAHLWLAQGNLAAASQWAQESGFSANDELNYRCRNEYTVLARVLIAQGRLDEASRLLARLLEMAETAGAVTHVIETLVLQVLALQAQGKDGQALTALERAVSLAEPEGYVRTFIDEGAPMAALLRMAASRGAAPDYVGKLLAAFGGTAPLYPAPIEPLSERELEVLRLLAAGLSNREIGAELFLAVGTVKKHTSNIYGKLNVHRRTQAVARARELGLV
jgi:LuxR family maltose regulon positive regulatory protein